MSHVYHNHRHFRRTGEDEQGLGEWVIHFRAEPNLTTPVVMINLRRELDDHLARHTEPDGSVIEGTIEERYSLQQGEDWLPHYLKLKRLREAGVLAPFTLPLIAANTPASRAAIEHDFQVQSAAQLEPNEPKHLKFGAMEFRQVFGSFSDGTPRRWEVRIGKLPWKPVKSSVICGMLDRGHNPYDMPTPHYEPDGSVTEGTIEGRYGLNQGEDWLPVYLANRIPRKEERTIYTWGYRGQIPLFLQGLLRDHNAVVFDARLQPQGRNFAWNKTTLQRQLGERYRWVQEWGNVNYNTKGAPIEIQNYAKGKTILDACHYRTIFIMCACVDSETCHRSVIADRLRRDGYNVSEFPSNIKPKGKVQPQPFNQPGLI